MKRLLAVLILLCLCISLVPAASAESGDWDFDAASGTLRLSGRGTMDELFAVRTRIAFLTTVTLPWREWSDTVRRVEIDEGVTTVSDFAFEGFTQLVSVVLPEGLEQIGSMAFNGCTALQSVVLPESLKRIDSFAFFDCASLSEVSYAGTAEQWAAVAVDSFNDPLAAAMRTAPGTPGTQTTLIPRPGRTDGDTPVPASPVPTAEPPLPAGTPTSSGSCGTGVKWSFYRSEGLLLVYGSGATNEYSYNDEKPWENVSGQITRVVVDKGVTELGKNVFRDLKNLSSVSLPEGLLTIGYSAFENCESLPVVTLPASLKTLRSSAFEGCAALVDIQVAPGSASFRSADGVLLSGDGKTLLMFPTGRSGEYTVPAGVTAIGSSAFAYCEGLTRATLPEGVTAIGNSAFNFCRNLKSIGLPSTLQEIGGFAFSGCYDLSDLSLPEGLRSLDTWTFYSCDSLTSILLPASLEEVADGTFCGCEGLLSIRVADGNRYLRSVDGLLYSADLTTLFAVPSGRIGAVVIVEGVKQIYEDAARDCGKITSVTLPRTLEGIDQNAFAGCTALSTVRYAGSRSDWSRVETDTGNGCLTDAKFEFLG